MHECHIKYIGSVALGSPEGKGTTEPIYPMCARVNYVTTDFVAFLVAFLSIYT